MLRMGPRSELGRFLVGLQLFLTSLAAAQSKLATPVREADAVCGRCHQQILSDYLKTPMANASGLASERLIPGEYHHATAGVSYAITKEGATAVLESTIPATPQFTTTEQLQYFLGSGHLGLTYLYFRQDYLLESPIAYYAALQAYAMKPGFDRMKDAPPALTLNPSCLRCHMSAIKPQVPGTDNLYTGLPFEHTGITCESCHGDARQHVASAGRAPIINPAKLSPERRDSTCVVCHLEGDTSVERRGRSVLDYKPGDDISDFLAYFVYAGENTTRRAVSEVEQFQSSRCRIATGPSMSCMSCHDPHVSIASGAKIAFYRNKCLACHTQLVYANAHHPSEPDCTVCHMPKIGSQNVAHVAWTDHRILRYPDQFALKPLSDRNQTAELLPVLSGKASPRDLALAYYNLVVAKGLVAERPRALQLLTAAGQSDPDDIAVLRALGISAEMSGDSRTAEIYYRSVLAKDPGNLAAGANLGTLLAKAGDLKSAVALWQRAFAQNADIPELGQNLAKAQCMIGMKSAAETTLQTVLSFSPGLSRARLELSLIENGQRACPNQATAP